MRRRTRKDGLGRKKSISDQQLLDVARDVFVEKGIAASTREIARRANISEAVIYQRHTTKANLFFAAMAPPAPGMAEIFKPDADDEEVQHRLEEIACGMLAYFRELMPILLPLVTHPSFDYEDFVKRHPESPLTLVREGLMEYLTRQAQAGKVRPEDIGPSGLTLVATLHSLALFEKLGVHGGHFDDEMVRGIVRSIWHGLKP